MGQMCGSGEPDTSPWPLEDEKLLQPAAGKRRVCAACRVQRRDSGVSGRHPDHAPPRPLLRLRDRGGDGAGAGSVADGVGAVCVGAAGNEGRTRRSGSHVDEPSPAHLLTQHVRDGQVMRAHRDG